jgi:hypothetical protein
MNRPLENYSNIYRATGGVYKEYSEIYRGVGNAWVRIWRKSGPLAVTVSPSTPFGSASSSATATVTTNAASLDITGGKAPYTISWARVGSGVPAWTILSPAANDTAFSVSVAPGVIQLADFEATVTDALGTIEVSPLVSATAENYGGYS